MKMVRDIFQDQNKKSLQPLLFTHSLNHMPHNEQLGKCKYLHCNPNKHQVTQLTDILYNNTGHKIVTFDHR